MSVQAIDSFIPTAPSRPAKQASTWSALFGEASRNTVRWWTADAFRDPHVSRTLLGVTYHAVSDPDAVQRILLDNVANYCKPRLLRRVVPLLADGLFGAEGQDWRGQRRLMAPVFTPAATHEFLPTFQAVARETADAWDAQAPGVIDVAAGSTQATFEVVSRALFSSAHGLAGDEASRHVAAMLAQLGQIGFLTAATRLLGVPDLNPMPGACAARAGERYLAEKLSAYIAARQADTAPPSDFMTRLLDAFAADHPPEEAATLALSNAFTFLVAGHESTANALAWTLYLLSEQPQAQAWAAEEARDALSTDAPLEHLTYLRWVLEEALRLYPPAPRIEREALADDQLGDLQVNKGDFVGIWPWLLHRHQALWDNPDSFEPERFSPEARGAMHRFQYIPFGAGPRICIGAQFATAEALLILAEWLARFEFAPVPGRRVEVVSDLALRPKGGLPLKVRRRV